MDFISQYNTYKFQRSTTSFYKPANETNYTSSRPALGGAAFIVLNAQLNSQAPARLRLYSDENSQIVDLGRPEGNYNISSSVSIIAEIVLTDNNLFIFDPPIVGTTDGSIYYTYSASNAPSEIIVTSYPLSSRYFSDGGKEDLTIQAASVLTTGYGVSGSITTCPKSFLIISASATSESRLRLYSRPVQEVPLSEQTRSFDTQSLSGSLLIADLMFDSASFKYPLSPRLEAYTYTSADYGTGTGEVGYILQNRSAGTTTITASLNIYSTED